MYIYIVFYINVIGIVGSFILILTIMVSQPQLHFFSLALKQIVLQESQK